MNRTMFAMGVLSLFTVLSAPRTARACNTATLCDTDNTGAATIEGQSTSNSPGGQGVFGNESGTSSTGAGVMGLSQTGFGGAFQSVNYVGVYAIGGNGSNTAPSGIYGVYAVGLGSGAIGVYGTSGESDAIYGVYTGTGSANGVEGDSASSGGAGVLGKNTGGEGVGVWGYVDGTSSTAYAVYGENVGSSGYAGYFSGNVKITGSLTVGTDFTLSSCAENSSTNCPSDQRLKKNIQPLQSAMDKLLSPALSTLA